MTMRQKITSIGFWAMVIAVALSVAIVIVVAIETPTTDPNPAKTAGYFAPVVALCAAFMALSQAANGRSLRIWPRPDIYIGGSSAICAYLWIVAESGNHLFDPELPIMLFLFFAIAVLGAFILTSSGNGDKQEPSNQPSKSENDYQ